MSSPKIPTPKRWSGSLRRTKQLFGAGVAAAAAIASCLGLPSATAWAQAQSDSITTISPLPRRTLQPQRPTPVIPRGTASGGSFGGTPANPFVTQVFRGPVEDDELPPDVSAGRDPNARRPVTVFDPNADPDADRVRSNVPVDGDFTPPQREPQPVDGDLSLPRTSFPVDGVADPSQVDTRTDEERAILDQPVGYDPTLFSIEVSPILTERPQQLFRFEPFEPLGIRAGSFLIFTTVETGVLFDSNVFESSVPERDIAFEVAPNVRIVSNWNVHALELGASGVFSKFREFDSEDLQSYTIQARGRLDVTRFTNVEVLVGRAVTQESRSTIDSSPVGGDRADVTTNTAAITVNHRLNRLRLQLRGIVTDQDTSDTVDETGVALINDDRDELETEYAFRASWEFKPTLFAFTEIAFNRRTFGAASLEDDFSRDSRGERYRVGVAFGNTDQILRGEISVGFGVQRPDSAALESLRGVIVDGNISWRMSALTTWLLTFQTDFDDTTTSGTVGSLSRSVGLEVRHALRDNVIANAGINFTDEEFEGIGLNEREFNANVGLEYFLNRNMALFARYEYTNFKSEEPGRDYVDNEVRIGLRLSQ